VTGREGIGKSTSKKKTEEGSSPATDGSADRGKSEMWWGPGGGLEVREKAAYSAGTVRKKWSEGVNLSFASDTNDSGAYKVGRARGR